MPEISVIVPVYNTASYLPACLDSLLAQRYPDFEAILVDDGSTDESPAILQDYAARDSRFRILTRENGGLSAARNSGIEAAGGSYLAFLDSDDTLHPDFLFALHEKAAAEDLDLVLCAFAYTYPDGSRKEAPTRHRLSLDPAREYALSEPMAPVRLIRRELWGDLRFRPGTLYEDLELTPILATRTGKIGFVDRALYDYRQRGGSIMNGDFSPRWLEIFSVLESLCARFEEAGQYENYHRELEYLFVEHLYRSAALRFCTARERKALFAQLKQAVESRFPRWRKNPYFRKSSLPFHLVATLAAGGHVRAVAMLARLRGL